MEMNSLQALSDPTRQRIVEMLAGGALSSGEIASRFDLSPPADWGMDMRNSLNEPGT